MNPVLLVNPNSRRSIYQGLADEFAAVEPPLWCRLLAAYLQGKNIPVEIWDTQIQEAGDADTAEAIVNAIKPSMCVVVAYGQQPSASTQTMPAVINLCKEINKLSEGQLPLVVLGTHPAALPARTLEESQADMVCTGEGFSTLAELYGLIEASPETWKYRIGPNNPRGVCYWDHGDVVFTNPAPLLWNMDEVDARFGWRDLRSGMNRDVYRAHNWHLFGYTSWKRKKYASIYTSLGCPFSCLFCCIQAPFKTGDDEKFHGKANSYRMWSPKSVVDEIEFLVLNYDIRHIKIADEMFLLNRNHVEGICGEMEKRKITDRHVNIWFYSRVDTVGTDERLLERMRKCGFSWAALGIESADDKSLESVDKRDYSNDQVIRSVRALQSAGMSVIGNYIFGLPDDTEMSIAKTYDLATSLNTEFMNLYCAVAFPGSTLYSDMVATGWEPPNWSAYSFHAYNHEPLPTKTLSAAEVLRLRDGAFQKYFRRDEYLNAIRLKFGEKAVDDVKTMTAVPLKRLLLGE